MKKLLVLFFSLFIATVIFAETTNSSEDKISEKTEQTLVQQIEQWYNQNLNYTTITILMTLESSLFPIPSEAIVPHAAYIASKPESHLNIYLVLLFATIGSMLGALINYLLTIYLGRPMIHKFVGSKTGHFLLLSTEKLIKAEGYFYRHDKLSIFVGRLIPVIRQFTPIPAGLARMNIGYFLLYTFLGAGVWNSVLTFLGFIIHDQQDLIDKYSYELSYLLLLLLVLFIVYVVIKQTVKWKKNRKTLSK